MKLTKQGSGKPVQTGEKQDQQYAKSTPIFLYKYRHRKQN